MDLLDIVKITCFYALVAAGETVNGIAMVSALSLCLLICYFYIPMLNIHTDSGLILLGVSLSLFMFAFDVTLGRLVMKAKWTSIFDELNLLKGNLLAVGMVLMAFCPLVSSRIVGF